MAIQIIEISVPGEIPSLVEINGGDGPQIVEINQGAQGEPGEQGAPGPNVVNTNTQTTLTGILKGDGANVGTATAGTDYLAPNGDGSGLTGLKVTRVFASQAEQNAATPDFVCQLAMRSDTGALLQSGAGVGEWVNNFTFDGLDIGANGIVSIGSISGSNIDASGNVTGNAATATALETSRNIFGLSFNGTANVTGDATNTGHFASIPTGGAAGHFITLNGTAPTVIAGRSAWFSDGSGVPSFRNGTGSVVTLTYSGGPLGTPSSGTLTNCTIPASAITGTTLASNVVTSSLTAVGTLGALSVTGTVTLGTYNTAGAAGFRFDPTAQTFSLSRSTGGTVLVTFNLASNTYDFAGTLFSGNGYTTSNSGILRWSSTGTAQSGSYDTGISRKTSSPGVIRIGNGTANDSSGSIECSTITLGTPLAASSGGTGVNSLGTGVATFLQTPTSSNLAAAVTDETGSGSLVFATSPTINTATAATSSATVAGLVVSGPTTAVDTLQIKGTSTASYSSIGLLDSTNTQKGSFGYGGSAAASYASTVFFNSASGVPIAFGPGGTEKVRFSAAGGVTIGATTDAGAGNLLVTGTITTNSSLNLPKTITAGGTTGAQTINKPSGSVNFAAGATSLVVTNSLCTTSSVILVSMATNDATANGLRVVAGSGSFTIYMLVAPTAETRVNFLLTN